MLLSDTLHEREFQIEIKKYLKGIEVNKTKMDHEQVLKNEERMKDREDREESERKLKALQIAQIQKEQRLEVREKTLRHLAQEKVRASLTS